LWRNTLGYAQYGGVVSPLEKQGGRKSGSGKSPGRVVGDALKCHLRPRARPDKVHYQRLFCAFSTDRTLCGQPALQQELASAAKFAGNPATSGVNFWYANGLVMSPERRLTSMADKSSRLHISVPAMKSRLLRSRQELPARVDLALQQSKASANLPGHPCSAQWGVNCFS
jgi:hypothetical protein